MAKGMRGGFGSSPKSGAGNMNKLLQQAQKMQAQLQKDLEDLSGQTFEVTSGGGAVRVVITGSKVLKELEIKPEIVDPDDIEMLQDVIIAAVNEAIALVESKTEEIQAAYTNGLM